MDKETSKTEYVTKQYLEEKLDERLSEQTQVILAAFDKRFSALDENLNKTREELKTDVNNVQTLIDGYVKAQEDFKQEFVVMKEEMKQIKQVLKEKFGLEIRAI